MNHYYINIIGYKGDDFIKDIENLLIGEFAKLCNISKRMLRHYDEIGLLKPAAISEENMYRMYNSNQKKKVEAIILLQSFGFALNEILAMYIKNISVNDFAKIVKEKQVHIREKIETDVYNMTQIKKFIITFEKSEQPLTVLLERELMKGNGKIMENNSSGIFKRYMDSNDYFIKQEKMTKDNKNDVFYNITFDIDRFLMVNEKCGFDVGDKVIEKTFSFIENNINVFNILNNEKGLYARTGGDEISIFLTGCDDKFVISLVEKCITDVSNYNYNLVGCNQKVSISAGVSKLHGDINVKMHRHESLKALMATKRKEKSSYLMIEK